MLHSVSRALSSALVPTILFVGVFFIIYLRGFFVIHPKKCLGLMLSEGGRALRELSVSLAGALGVGNIVGVAVAISVGGAGAVFWMWISAVFAMILKYCEIVLSLGFREKTGREYVGGPMYYMRDGIGGAAGRTLAFLFAGIGIFASVALGNIVQAGALASAGKSVGIHPAVTGIVMGACCAAVVFGGFSGVSKFSSVVVPAMSAVYIFVSLRAIFICRENLPGAILHILSDAFEFDSAAGGILGFLLSPAARAGMAKGAFSHEAGSGTAPMAHVQAEPKTPAAQGLFGMAEVIFDTLIMCTLTSLVILTSGVGESGLFGAELMLSAFEVTLGGAGKYMLAVFVAAFSFSTLICWSYYGRMCLSYFTKSTAANRVYLCLYCAFVIVGAITSEGAAWELADIFVTLMTAINLAAVFRLRGCIKKETDAVFRVR